MTVTVLREQDVVREAFDVLWRNLSPSKVVRLWAALQMGEGDYLTWRDELFADESVDTLFEKVQA
jgi:hypothetical protein